LPLEGNFGRLRLVRAGAGHWGRRVPSRPTLDLSHKLPFSPIEKRSPKTATRDSRPAQSRRKQGREVVDRNRHFFGAGGTDGTSTDPIGRLSNGNVPSGRCEKIDKQMWSEFGLQNISARMPYKRSRGRRHTFCIKLETSQFQPNQFLHIFLSLHGRPSTVCVCPSTVPWTGRCETDFGDILALPFCHCLLKHN
jgi:hypothetical protein